MCRRSARSCGSSGGKRRPDPHGHGSLRPSFSTSSVSVPTTRSPHLTLDSLEGTPAALPGRLKRTPRRRVRGTWPSSLSGNRRMDRSWQVHCVSPGISAAAVTARPCNATSAAERMHVRALGGGCHCRPPAGLAQMGESADMAGRGAEEQVHGRRAVGDIDRVEVVGPLERHPAWYPLPHDQTITAMRESRGSQSPGRPALRKMGADQHRPYQSCGAAMPSPMSRAWVASVIPWVRSCRRRLLSKALDPAGATAIGRRFQLALAWLTAGALLGLLIPFLGVAMIAAFNVFYWLPIRGESPHHDPDPDAVPDRTTP